MKKRKPPVVLASILIVLVSVAVIMALPKRQNDDHAQKLTAEDAIPSGTSRPTPSKDELKGHLAGASSRAPEDEAMGPLGANPLKNNPKSATIFLPKAGTFKPTPNDSAVSGQWYRDSARASDVKGFKNP